MRNLAYFKPADGNDVQEASAVQVAVNSILAMVKGGWVRREFCLCRVVCDAGNRTEECFLYGPLWGGTLITKTHRCALLEDRLVAVCIRLDILEEICILEILVFGCKVCGCSSSERLM